MRTITYTQYLQAQGLLYMVRQAYEREEELVAALAGVLGEESESGGYYGHVSDSVTEQYSLDDLLKKLRIEVLDERE